MGRLVDEDKVIKIIERRPEYSDYWNNITDMRDEIKALPEVDSIPIAKVDEILYKFSKWLGAASEKNMIDVDCAESHLRELFYWERNWDDED